MESFGIEQGSQTRGPPNACVWPVNISKIDKIIYFDQIYLNLRAFLVNCGPQKLFSYKLRPAEHCSLECGPPIHLSLRPLV